jgi:hypothetical protein
VRATQTWREVRSTHNHAESNRRPNSAVSTARGTTGVHPMAHGDFTHIEIPADDVERAKHFYG